MEIREDIAYPDPVEAKKFRRLGIVVALSMLAAMYGLWQWLGLKAGDAALPLEKLRLLFAALPFAITVPVSAFGVWIVVIGRRVSNAEQWPYPGAKLVRPVRVVRGQRAQVRARMLMTLGVLLTLVGLAAGAYVHYSFRDLLNQLERVNKTMEPTR